MAWFDEAGVRAMQDEAKKLATSLTESQQESLILACCQYACAADGYTYMEMGLYDKRNYLHYHVTEVKDEDELDKRVLVMGELLRAVALGVFDRKDATPTENRG